MILNDAITRCRAFLRDPAGDIWTDTDIVTYYNDAQLELAQKVGMIERVESHYYPQPLNWAYLYDWEHPYVDGDYRQALRLMQTTGEVACFPWEVAWWQDTLEGYDDGDQITQPWEAAYANFQDQLPMLLHDRFHRMKFAAYDKQEITPLSFKEVSGDDQYFRSREGVVTNYYRPDEHSNELFLYPKPSTIVFQETDEYDVLSDTGGLISSSEAWRDTQDIGVTTDVIVADDALFMVYECLPDAVEDWAEDELSWPNWMVKYTIYGTLERCFGADTDGFIPTLRDYWKARKELGIQALKKFQRLRMTDRDYRLGGNVQKTRTRGGNLPAGYPAI